MQMMPMAIGALVWVIIQFWKRSSPYHEFSIVTIAFASTRFVRLPLSEIFLSYAASPTPSVSIQVSGCERSAGSTAGSITGFGLPGLRMRLG